MKQKMLLLFNHPVKCVILEVLFHGLGGGKGGRDKVVGGEEGGRDGEGGERGAGGGWG